MGSFKADTVPRVELVTAMAQVYSCLLGAVLLDNIFPLNSELDCVT